MIDIKGLDKAEVLAALYNNSQPIGLGQLQYVPGDLPMERAASIVASRNGVLNFEYMAGRVMKVDISDDEFDEWLYDRDNGTGAAERAIAPLRGN